MTIQIVRIFFFCLVFVAFVPCFANDIPPDQDEYERSIDAVLRHKHFYKKGHLEFTPVVGVMPYDSLINHYMLGGRAAWHFTDHFSWEILDAQITFPSTTSYFTGLVKDKGLSDVQTPQLKMLLGTNFLVSPFYGKVRIVGRSVLHFDIYLLAGLGMAKAEQLRLSASGVGGDVSESILRSNFDPMATVGFGIKLFLNNVLGLVVDMRDYIVYTPIYGNKQIKSNFSVFGGLSIFLPSFG
ncbi:MAG: outer membrane beta-barrel domain-containing protein [Deltaproteobacteria bacterium]|nr:outer membrane beta-barrel domain-containing protein [Deltaproteobacteria bacterium]